MQESTSIPELKNVRVLAALNGLELFGHERGNIEVFKALREMGAEVRIGVNAREDGGAVGAHLRELGFSTFPLLFGNQWSWQWLKRYPTSVLEKARQVWQCSREFRKQIRKVQPTHFHLGSPLAYSFLSLALARSKVPLVYRMGDAPPVDSSFQMRLWRMAVRRATYLAPISSYVRSQIEAAGGGGNIRIIYNLAPSSLEAGNSDGGPPLTDDLPILYVGSIAEHKGVSVLIEAFAQIAALSPGICLWILGQSAYDAEVRRKLQARVSELGIASKVLFAGHSKTPAIWYRRAAIHVAPSLWEEPLGNVVLEAKREGVPSIVFPSGGLPEMVRHQVDGFVCGERSVAALREAILWMLADKERLKKLGSAALEQNQLRFGKARFLQEWAEVYRLAERC
jgi:glycosyltransferase involved in cell wall biosynthesis